MITLTLLIIVIQMMIQLSVEDALCQRFLQILDKVTALECIQGIGPIEELIK